MPWGEIHKQGFWAPCHWCGKTCGGTCLGLTSSTQMKPTDPAYRMLKDGHASIPEVHRLGCYICDDVEFAQMGMPLCKPCPACAQTPGQTGHVPADDPVCSDCGYDLQAAYERDREVG